MLSRLSVVTCCLSLAALCAAGSASALQLPLPPPGEDIVGQVQVIKAKYEDTFADLGTTYDLGYSEMVAANPGVDAWLPGAGTEIVLPSRWLKDADTRLNLGGVAVQVVHRGGGHTPGDSMVWLPQSGVVFTGDVVYVDRILGLHPVSKTKTWVQSFEALEALSPKTVVPGHGKVTTLAQAQKDTGALLKALRKHMGTAVEVGTDISLAVKSFDATPFKHLQHVDVWLPQLANRTFLEMEQE